MSPRYQHSWHLRSSTGPNRWRDWWFQWVSDLFQSQKTTQMELPNPSWIMGNPPKESALRDRLIGFRLISDRFQTHMFDAACCSFRLHFEKGCMMVSPLALGILGQARQIWGRMGSWETGFAYTANDSFRVKQATRGRAGTWIAAFLQTLHQHLVHSASAGALASWCLGEDGYQRSQVGSNCIP